MTVENLVEARTDTIDAQVGVDPVRAATCTLAKIRPVGNLDNLVFLDEGDLVCCRIAHAYRSCKPCSKILLTSTSIKSTAPLAMR
jgi:hypothetical protein